MGFFDNKSKEDYIEEMLVYNNVFEGIRCEAIFPNKQLQIASSSGKKKGLATLAFGLVGLAATSGVKHEEKKRKLITTFQIVDKGVVFKKATMNGEDLRIPYENIIKSEKIDVKPMKVKVAGFNKRSVNMPPTSFKILLLKNQEIVINLNNLKLYSSSYFINHITKVINERACGAQYEEAGWGLEHATAEPQEVKEESGSLMDELERLGNMYKEGLLTEEEFGLAKKKLLGGD